MSLSDQKKRLSRVMVLTDVQFHRLADGTCQDSDINAAVDQLKILAAHVEAEVARIAKECDMPFLCGTLHVGSLHVGSNDVL